MKKFSLFLLIALLLTVSASAVTLDATIDSAEELKLLMDSEDADVLAGAYTLSANIDMSAVTGQSPIGSASVPFTGTFDGGGHTVSGINIVGATSATGFFGKTIGATVKNLTLAGNITASSKAATAGFIGFSAGSVTIENCVNRVRVDGDVRVGGFIGSADSAAASSLILRGCVNEGEIIAAGINANEKALHCGGLIGRLNLTTSGARVTIENCENRGLVRGGDCTGGIVGRFQIETNGKNSVSTLQNLKNTGTVRSLTSAEMTDCAGAELRYVGGIVGLFTNSGEGSTHLLDQCLNTAPVHAEGIYAGGIVGFYRSYHPNTTTFQNCENTGAVSSAGNYAGGIVGKGSTDQIYTMRYCFSSGSVICNGAYTGPVAGNLMATAVHEALVYKTDATYPYLDYQTALSDADLSAWTTGGIWLVCDGVPTLAKFHTHTLGDFVNTSVAGHYKACACGYATETEAHTFENSLCTVCGASSCPHAGERTFDSVLVTATCAKGGIDLYLCGDCGNLFEVASDIDPDNHSGGAVLAGDAAVYVCADCGAPYATRIETTVYVSATGATVTPENAAVIGNADAPFASFTDAMAHAARVATAGVTVTVQIVDSAKVPSGYVSPNYDGHVVITGGNLSTANQFSLGGALTVEKITITPSTYTVWEARGHKLTMGSGIVMGKETPMYAVGGWDSHFSATGDLPQDYATDLTLRSGLYNYVSGGNRDLKGEYRGSVALTVGAKAGDTLTVTKKLCTASLGDDFATKATLTLTIDGDVDFAGTGILYPLSGSDRGERSNFDAEISLSGTLRNLSGVRYMARTYEADMYVDTSIDGIEETVAKLMRGEVRLHAIESETVPAALTASTAFGEVGIHAFTYGNVRVTLLSDTAVRIEDANGDFVDGATLMVPHREEFAGAAVAVDEKDGIAILETASIVVNLPTEGATVSDVRVYDKSGEVLFDYYTSYQNGFYSSLPAPADTPKAYILCDNGILPAETGMVYVGSTDATSGWRTTDNIDLYVLCPFGDAAALRRDYVTLTGRTNLSDIKFYGSWYSRWSRFTSEQKLAMIEEYRDHDMPLDVIIIDTEWRANTDGTGYNTNETLYPDMADFLAKAEAAGVYVLFNDHTHKTSLSILTPEEFKWQCANIAALMDLGLDGWWYDRNWSYTIQSPYADVMFSTVGQVLYYDTMAKYHADTAVDGESQRVLMLTNADWLRHGFLEGNPSVTGHRYGMQWSGDIYGDSLQLGREIENAVTAGVVGGSPHISADLGGFRNNDVVSENAFIRWMQFAAFSGAVRVHSDINPKNPHYPWSYTEVGETAIHDILHARYHLMPYHYALAREVYDSGMPLMRRLDFYYPEYIESQDNSQYLLGRDILVAPYTGSPGDGAFAVPAAWLHTSDGVAGLEAAYYATGDVAKDRFFVGEPAYTERVTEVVQFWDRWAPNGVDVEYFAARYVGQITPAVDCYLGLVVDDGGRIFIDGELYAGTYTNVFADSQVNTETPLKAGETYDIVIEYYERTSKSQLHLVYDPVTAMDESERSVFIPDGEWIDVYTGEVITGPKTITVTKDVYSMPLYVRRGAVLPAAKVESPLTKADWQNLSLNLYGLGEGSAVLYEDDGRSEDYKNGESRFTAVNVTTDGDITTLTLSAADGSFETDYAERSISVRVHSDTPIVSALVNGSRATVTKIEKDSTAIPFANSGASPASDVYEITFTASIAQQHTVVVSTGEELIPADVGDVDGDKVLTVKDALLTLKAILNRTAVNADMNGDGRVSVLDVVKILTRISQ